MRNLLILPDGSELISGTVGTNTINSTTFTQSVNSGDELTLGSAFANILELSIKDYARLSLTAGDEVTLYRVDNTGKRVKKGIFILEKPTRPSPNTLKLTGYDRVMKLDKDLTEWLNGLDGWPYELTTFAGMVCGACELDFVESDVPNGDFLVYQFTKSSVTGRQIMKWLGEICCRFCRANANGAIEFAWYRPSGVTIAPTGDRYYFQGALSYETYQVAPIEAVQLRLADSDSGALWPEADAGANSYIISGNAILMARVTEDLLPYLKVIEKEIAGVTYTPCKVAIPACMDIDAGSIVNITDKNGAQITAYVMTKTTKGQQDTLECTGSARRDSSTATNNKTNGEKTAQAVQNAFAGLTQEQIFNKLTNNGALQGIYMDDNQLYINASYIKSGKIVVEGKSRLRPTYDDGVLMLRSLVFPDKYPPKGYYDINGDGVFDDVDVDLAIDVIYGNKDVSVCKGLAVSDVTVTINPFDTDNTVIISGTNVWGSEVITSIGVNSSRIPTISGDCVVGGRLIANTFSTTIADEPKKLSWKDNGDGTYTLIGQ